MPRTKSCLILLSIVILISPVWQAHGQGMLKQLHKQQQKINASLGFRVGEPMGINIQFFKGETASRTKSKSVIDINIGKEGVIFSLGPGYKTGSWRPGGTRYSVSWFREVNHKLFGQYLYFGLGVQGGSRKYQRLAIEYQENFTWGPQATLHSELPLGTITITPSYLYCKITLFAEGIYYYEVGERFSYIRPAGGVRLNFFY